MLFKRKAMADPEWWKNNHDGRSAALIEGARRVGKTTVVSEFVKNNYESYLILDFSEEPAEILELFNDGSNLDRFFFKLQLLKGVDLHERKSAIVFDEVQLFPCARQMIKQLVKDHRYDIETGFLISIQRNVKDIRIPSEEHPITMYPMDFEEWLWANGEVSSAGILRGFFESREPLGM